MKSLLNMTFLVAILLVAASCSDKSELEQKKEELKGLKTEVQDLKKQIVALESEIVELDPTFGKNENNTILITALKVKPGSFEHKIEVRGSVESRRNVILSAQISGEIERIRVKEGQRVQKGQVLVELDADIIKNNVAELKTSLDLATVVFERQEKLWNQNIGTEIQYLEAKNSKESLERRLATVNAQLAQATVRAPFSGSVDAIPAREGEITMPGAPLIRMVNPDDVYIKADVSEKFISSFESKDDVEIMFPTQNKKLMSTISAVGQVINTNNRTFEIEINLPNAGFAVKPNQVVVLNLQDYENKEAIKVPTRLILKDNKGSFVYRIVEQQGESIVKKAHVELGVSFRGETEILSGLEATEMIADKGFRELADGVAVKVTKDKAVSVSSIAAGN